MSVGRFLLFGLILLTSELLKASSYELVELGFAGAATDINDQGQIVGRILVEGNGQRPFVYDHGQLTILDLIGSAEAINNQGQIVGNDWANNRPFMYGQGVITYLDVGQYTSEAWDINDSGQIVGGYFTEPPDGTIANRHGFLWDGGGVTDLGTLGGIGSPNSSQAVAINSSAQIVGTYSDDAGHDRPFLYDDGVMHDLGTLGGRVAIASDINDQGQIVGDSAIHCTPLQCDTASAFIFQDGTMQALAELGNGIPYGINDQGQIVGMLVVSGNVRPFLYEQGTVTELATIRGNGVPDAINAHGQIVGQSEERAVLWQPTVPEPTSAVATLIWLIPLLLRAAGWRTSTAD
jgi:probable HAF family extracellular repeat protein